MTSQGNSSTCTVLQLKKPRICSYSRLQLGLWQCNDNKNISVTWSSGGHQVVFSIAACSTEQHVFMLSSKHLYNCYWTATRYEEHVFWRNKKTMQNLMRKLLATDRYHRGWDGKKNKIDLKDIRRALRSFVHQRRTVLKELIFLFKRTDIAHALVCERCGGGVVTWFCAQLRTFFVCGIRHLADRSYRCAEKSKKTIPLLLCSFVQK
jgi:hypothetical protein